MFDPILAHLAEEGMVFVAGVVGVIAVAVVTIMRSKARRPSELDDVMVRRLDEIGAQLSRLEMLVDTSALEIERISEGQRFTTRLLSERTGEPPPPVGDVRR